MDSNDSVTLEQLEQAIDEAYTVYCECLLAYGEADDDTRSAEIYYQSLEDQKTDMLAKQKASA